METLTAFLCTLYLDALAAPDVAKVSDRPSSRLTIHTDHESTLHRVYFRAGQLHGLRDWWAHDDAASTSTGDSTGRVPE